MRLSWKKNEEYPAGIPPGAVLAAPGASSFQKQDVPETAFLWGAYAREVAPRLPRNGNQTAYNVYGNGTLLCHTVGGQTYYYIYNGHGDVTGLTDGSGNVAASYYYDAFGNVTAQTGSVESSVTYAG